MIAPLLSLSHQTAKANYTNLKFNAMQSIPNKIRVLHYPQVPCSAFFVDVQNEREAYLVAKTLADQHNFLYDNNIIPDFSNAINVVMWDEDSDGEGNPDWVDYYKEAEVMDWDEIVEAYFEA